MPISIKQLFNSLGKEILGQVKWGQKIDCKYPGIYVVAITHSAEKIVCLDEAPISVKAVRDWLDSVPKLVLDGIRPRYEDLRNRLKEFWIPDETILYCHLAN